MPPIPPFSAPGPYTSSLNSAQAPVVPPALGPAATGPQPAPVKGGGVHSMFGVGAQLILTPPPPGDYSTYRRMREDPTISIARAASTLPIKGAPWSYELDEEAGGTDEMAALVRRNLEPMRAQLLADAIFGIDYGWQSWELVWGPRKGTIALLKAKPLTPELTTIEVDRNNGDFIGVSQYVRREEDRKVEKILLQKPRCMLFTHDREGQNWYGRSRHENIREHAWHPWCQMAKRIDTYTAKGAGVIFMLEYPGEGEWVDRHGKRVTSDEAAETLMATVGQMGSVAVPRIIQAGLERMLQNTTNPAALMQWQMKFIEAAAGHGAEFQAFQRYYDALKMRGWFVPERATTEGTHGTLAEAEAHAELGMAMAADVNEAILETFNGSIVDPLLEFNFGAQARGLVRLKAATVSSEHLAFLRDLIKGLLLDPSNIELVRRVLDLDSALDQADVPKLGQVVDANDPAVPEPAPGPLARARSKFHNSLATLLLGARGRRVERP